MNTPEPTEADIARLRDASEWVQRLSESSEQTLADEWLDWCRSDPLNLLAFEGVQHVWQGFSGATAASRQPQVRASRLTRRRLRAALAASVLLLVSAGTWFALSYDNALVLDTAVGAQRRVTLADGSLLDLAPASRATVRISSARRDVLLERGQAFFTVAHDTTRPFVVHTNGLTVTAVGTAFDVRIGPSNTVVTVREGRVSVAPVADDGGSDKRFDSEATPAGIGVRATFSKSSRKLSVLSVDPTTAGSWRDGILRFVGEPLQEVVGEVNRYSARTIAVVPAFEQVRFTGTVAPQRVDDWLKALEQIYAVDVVDRGANGLQIQSRGQHGSAN